MKKKQTSGGGDAAKGTTMFSKTVAKHSHLLKSPATPKGGKGGAKKNKG